MIPIIFISGPLVKISLPPVYVSKVREPKGGDSKKA